MSRKRLNLLAVAIIAAGTCLRATAPAQAQYEKKPTSPTYCCAADNWGLDQKCCGPNGCRIQNGVCSTW